MNIIDRFTIAHRHAEALMELGKKVGAAHGDLQLGIGSEPHFRFRVVVYVSMMRMTAEEFETNHARAIGLAKLPYAVSKIYGDTPQFTIEWVEPFCKQCDSSPVAYEGAIYCGAGCSERAEGGR